MNQTYMLNDEPVYDEVGHRLRRRGAVRTAISRKQIDYFELDELMRGE